MFLSLLFVFAFTCGSAINANPFYEQDDIFTISVVGTESLMASILSNDVPKPYRVYGKANWFMAQDVCTKGGMKLVKINDQNKNEDVTKFVETLRDIPGPFWTLASKIYDGTTWAFSIRDPVKYFNWANSEPSKTDDMNCVEIHKDGQWYNNDCSLEQFILCEKV